MRKEIIEKIVKEPKQPFAKTVEMTPAERTELQESMQAAGMPSNTLYQRMAYRGFDAWELCGIQSCMDDFWQMARREVTNTPQLSDFWQTLVETGHNTAFIKYMEVQGMSRNTTIKRFNDPDFKPWEIDGIAHILNRLQ